MHLLLTTYHTLLLFSPPLLETSPIPGLFSSCSSFFSQFSPFSIVCYFNASLSKLVSSMSHNLFQYFTILSTIFSFLFVLPNSLKSRVSSGSIVSDYGLDDRAIGVRSPAGVKDFSSSLLCPDQLWDPPSLLYNGYRGSFPGGKARPGRDADHSPPSSAEVVNEKELYLSLQAPSWCVAGLLYFFLLPNSLTQAPFAGVLGTQIFSYKTSRGLFLFLSIPLLIPKFLPLR
jgi:hypothetical protein